MRMYTYFSLLAVGILVAVCNSCGEPRDFSTEIRTLDSLEKIMADTEHQIDSIEMLIADSITQDLQYIQENFKGEMKEYMARALIRYGELREKIENLNTWKDSLHIRKEQLENEIKGFRQALADKATHDANHVEITKLYVDSMVREIDAAGEFWHTKVNEWIQLQKQLHKQWLPLNDSITYWTDSIQPTQNP